MLHLKLRLYVSENSTDALLAKEQIEDSLAACPTRVTYALEILNVVRTSDLPRDTLPFTPLLERLEPHPHKRFVVPVPESGLANFAETLLQ